MRIAYAIQNVGIRFDEEVGDMVPVKHTLQGLQKAGHTINCFYLSGRNVVGIDNIKNLQNFYYCPQGITGTRFFRFFESGIRRVQKMLRLPYYAFFDSYRFYEACVRCLPGYDICHERQGNFSVGAAFSCLRLGIPYVLTVSSPPFLENELFNEKPYRGVHKWVGKLEMRFIYRVAVKIICVSESSKKQLIEDWQVDPNKIVIMPNGVDVEYFEQRNDPKSVRTKYKLESNPLIGFVGNFQKWHGIDLLLKSFTRILEQIPDARILLVGDGPARLEIDKWIAGLNLESKVIITGYVPRDKVSEFLDAIDVAVIPYPRFSKELWFSPLKMYEYMAAGKAIVASRYGQIADVLEDGRTGILVEPGDVDELTRAILMLLNDEGLKLQLGKNAFDQAKNHHSWDRYISRLEDIYSSVI